MAAKQKAILIDGNSILFRMFYGIRGMANSKGVPTNAVYGFVKLLQQIQNEMRPDYLGVAFDLPEPTFRHEKFDDYKAGRDKMPDELITQLDLMKKLLGEMQVPVLTLPGYEADDIVGTVAKAFAHRDEPVLVQIITGDRDSFQLVEDNIHILYTTTRSGSQFVEMDPAAIEDKYGVEPADLIQVKALMGDTSDNIPGIKGIGEKTALKFVKKYKTVDGLYAHIDELKGKQKEKVEAGKDNAYLSLFLGRIDVKAPVKTDDKALAMNDLFNPDVMATLKELEFSSIIRSVERTKGQPQTLGTDGGEAVPFSHLDSEKDLYFLQLQIAKWDRIALHLREEEDAAYLAVSNFKTIWVMDDPKLIRRFIHEFDDLPNADDLAVTGHDLKTLIHAFEAEGASVANLGFDTYIAAYLLEPTDRRYALSDLARKYLDRSIPDEESLFGKGKKRKKLGDLAPEVMAPQMAKECQVLIDLEKELRQCLEEQGMTRLYEDIEMPLIEVLASMESIGFQIDVDQLKDLSKTFESRIHDLTDQIYNAAGREFNINSTKQLGQVLFEELQLPAIKKTKTGYSTSVEVLEQLAPYHDIVPAILEYRTVTKLDSTYGAGLIKYVDPKTQRVYSHFNQTVTATGRISSSDPNLQNIPVRTDLGREIRKVFIPESPDRTLLDADYSQIELRVLAHLTGDENLIQSFKREEDIHARTASEIFGVSLEKVTREQRSHAKAVNFGLIYGKQAFSLGKELGISRQQAQNYIDMYFARYPKVQAYMENIVASAKEKGYVTTLFGRRRNIPEIQSRNGMIRKSGERIALNTPIQGTAADIMKMAMIRVYKRLQKESLRSHLILQIHDELIIDAPKDEADDVLALLIEEMENTVQLAVPLVVDAHEGDSWYAIK